MLKVAKRNYRLRNAHVYAYVHVWDSVGQRVPMALAAKTHIVHHVHLCVHSGKYTKASDVHAYFT